MPWKKIDYQNPRIWNDIIIALSSNPFSPFLDELTALDISLDDAMQFFISDYVSARTPYSDDTIYDIFQKVHDIHSKKYSKLIAAYQAEYDPLSNYDMTEIEGNARRISETESTNKQYGESVTVSTIPTMKNSDYTTTYDSTVENRLSNYSISEPTGTNAAESGTNIPATRTTTSQNAAADGKQGIYTSQKYSADESIDVPFDTPESFSGHQVDSHKLTRKGNIGVTTSQQLLEQELLYAQKMNIFRIIEQDIAKAVFIQVW